MHWLEVLPIPIYTVQYEDLIEDPEGIGREMVEFCGFEWEPECLDFYKSKRVVRTASLSQVKQPIYKTSSRRWRKFASKLGPLLEAFPEWVER